MLHREVTLDDRYSLAIGETFLTGIQALVRLPIEQARLDAAAGHQTAGYISGYRGSPLGGYDQQLRRAQKHLDAAHIHFGEGLNEDLAATAVWGSQQVGLFPGARFDGVFGLWYGKAPGVDRTGDVFKHANFAGTSPLGGVLAIAGDDHHCKSSTLPSQSEFAFIDAEMPVFSPANIQDVLDYGLFGYALSRFSGLWVGLIALADMMDAGSVVAIGHQRLNISCPPTDEITAGDVHIRRHDNPMDKETRLRTIKLARAKAFVAHNRLNRPLLGTKAAKYGIVVTGQAAEDIFEALAACNIGHDLAREIGLEIYKIAMPWPLATGGIIKFAKGLERLFVLEHKRALMEPQIKAAFFDAGISLPVFGKQRPDGRPLLGDIAAIGLPEMVAALCAFLPDGPYLDGARAYLAKIAETNLAAGVLTGDAARTPHFCSGCPHNTSTTLPEGSRALAGIGCHYMATFMPERETDMTSQMGGEGVGWLGQAPFSDQSHIFVNLGDGTYSHSGSLAIRAAVAAKANMTYKLLYNDAVAMTGGQSPESGQSVQQIARQLLGEGVARVVVVADDLGRYRHGSLGAEVSLFHRRDFDLVQRQLRDTKGVTVLIYDQICATEKRRRVKRGLMLATQTRVYIDPAICEGCGDCSVQSNCLSIQPLETEWGTKRKIDQSSCNQDVRCIDGFCPAFTTIEGAQNATRTKARPSFDASRLPIAAPPSLNEAYNVVFAGVGGTGVTTVAAILGMAAHVEGLASCTLDMTGLAQKGGAVISHIRMARHRHQLSSTRVPPASADLLLAADLIVSTNVDALMLMDKGRTNIVANEDIMPTAEFISNRRRRFRANRKLPLIEQAGQSLSSIHAEALAEKYLFDALFANMILMGFGWQKGLLPVSLRAIYRAIKLNGAAIKDNLMAFDLGRLAAHDPARLETIAPVRAPPPEMALAELIRHRGKALTRSHGVKAATNFSATIKELSALLAGKEGAEAIIRAGAISLAKAMAYKDEYEVARLYSRPEYLAGLKETLAGGKKRKIWLAPPFLGAGTQKARPRKMGFGAWVSPMLYLLQFGAVLRGSMFDPFGHTEERKKERQLIGDIISDLQLIGNNFGPENGADCLALARLGEDVRGFGPVKMAAFDRYYTQRKSLIAAVCGHLS